MKDRANNMKKGERLYSVNRMYDGVLESRSLKGWKKNSNQFCEGMNSNQFC